MSCAAGNAGRLKTSSNRTSVVETGTATVKVGPDYDGAGHAELYLNVNMVDFASMERGSRLRL